jgi:hypothetical protein
MPETLYSFKNRLLLVAQSLSSSVLAITVLNALLDLGIEIQTYLDFCQ